MRKIISLTLLTALFMLFPGIGADAQVTEEDYQRAEQFIPQNLAKLVFKVRVEPRWIENSSRFWYRNDTRDGKEFIVVDPAAGSK